MGNAAGTKRKFVPVFQNKANDLAEAERDDGKIIPSQSQHREAQQNPKDGGKQSPNGQNRPEAQPEMIVDQGIAVSPHRVKGHEPEIEKSRQSDHDIQPQPQHNVHQGGYHDISLVAGKDERKNEG